MAVLLTNIDGVRAQIMELESAVMYDDQAWQRVLADLRAAGRVSAAADAARRMQTAKINQSVPVAVATAPTMREGFAWCGKEYETIEQVDCVCNNLGSAPDWDCSECGGTGECEDICCEYHGVLAMEVEVA